MSLIDILLWLLLLLGGTVAALIASFLVLGLLWRFGDIRNEIEGNE